METAVKATYLYKFIPFVTWPDNDPSRPMTICLVGDDPFGPGLDHAVAAQQYMSRPLRIERLPTLEATRCDVAYISGAPQFVAANLKLAEGQPVLTVTDNANSAAMLDFVVVSGRVRFRASPAVAKAAHLAISSKLLSLAVEVR